MKDINVFSFFTPSALCVVHTHTHTHTFLSRQKREDLSHPSRPLYVASGKRHLQLNDNASRISCAATSTHLVGGGHSTFELYWWLPLTPLPYSFAILNLFSFSSRREEEARMKSPESNRPSFPMPSFGLRLPSFSTRSSVSIPSIFCFLFSNPLGCCCCIPSLLSFLSIWFDFQCRALFLTISSISKIKKFWSFSHAQIKLPL